MEKQVSAELLGYRIEQDDNGHWNIYDGDKRLAGPWFNRPAIAKKWSKGELRTCAVQNPTSENPNYYIIDSDSKFV